MLVVSDVNVNSPCCYHIEINLILVVTGLNCEVTL